MNPQALAEKVNKLSPPDRLRLAAMLMDEGRGDLALPILQRVAGELSLALVLSRS